MHYYCIITKYRTQNYENFKYPKYKEREIRYASFVRVLNLAKMKEIQIWCKYYKSTS